MIGQHVSSVLKRIGPGRRPWRVLGTGIVLLLLSLYPPLTQNTYLMVVLTLSAFSALFASSFNLLAGFANQVNLGHALFFGTGAYAAAFLSLNAGVPPWLAILSGGLVAVAISFLMAVLCLRLRGPYLILTTVAFGMVAYRLVFSFSRITGGEEGLSGLPSYCGSVVGNYFLAIALVGVTMWLLSLLVRSKVGLALRAIRDDETLAWAMGIDIVHYKLLAFIVSGFLAGVSGSLYGFYLGQVGPETLSITTTFSVIVMVTIGGWGTIIGPVLGAFTLGLFNELLHPIWEWRPIIWAVVVLLVLFIAPGGVVRTVPAIIRRLTSRWSSAWLERVEEGRK